MTTHAPHDIRRALCTIVLLASGTAPIACVSKASDTTGPTGQVAATVQATPQLRFSPDTVTIRAGQSVRWANTATFTHTVTDDPTVAANAADAQLPAGAAAFDSGPVTGGSDYVHTFTTPGVYHYFCRPHETLGMLGTVIVTP